MNLYRDRTLDRVWLALSGAAALSAGLQSGVQIGLRPWSSGEPVLAAQAAVSDVPARTARRGAGCRDGQPGRLR